MKTRQQIVQDLTKDGFTNVRIVPDSFLIHATNKSGEQVVMIINPDSVFSVTALPSTRAGATATADAQHSPATNGSGAGSTTGKP